VHTCQALNAGNLLNSGVTAMTPSAVEGQLLASGLDMNAINVPQNSSVSNSITSQI
jgi:hypothetical protein